jgi:crotonobetainyl-CoA:carnitine CoA-transferase CaiB-like acyl-CoA transferase
MFFPTFFAASGRPMRTVRIRSIPLIHPTTDGYVGFQITTGQQWQDFAAMIGRPDWAEDPSLTRFDARIARFDEVNSTVDAWTSQRTTREVTELGALFRLPVAPVANGQTVPQIDQVVQRSWMVEHPGGFIAPDVPYTFHGGAKKRIVGSPPSLGHDTERFRSHPNPAKDEEPTGRPRPLPFEGIRIVDFTAYWAGPIISHFFAMMGADVIHVESIKRPDGIRAATLKFDMSAGWWEASPAFAGTNTNKRDLTLDMSTEAGRGLARRLVAHCDVVLDNYSTRVMPQWGLDPDTLRMIKPDLIVVRAPGFGLTGPWADRVAYATTIEQASGAAWMTGFADDRPDVTGGAMDPVAGTHAAFALLLALEHRRRTGNGLVLEVPQFTSGINVCAEQIIEYSASNVLLGRIGNRSWVTAPQGTYRVLDQERSVEGLPADEWIALSVENDEQWLSLCQLLDREDLRTDTSLRSVVGRQASHDLIDQAIHNWTRTRRGNDVVELAASAGIPCALWAQTHQLVAIPQVVARQLYEQVDNPGLGLVPIVGYPAQFEQGPRRVHRRRAPLLGEHNHEILGGLLGLSDEEIAALEGNEVIGSQASSMSAW